MNDFVEICDHGERVNECPSCRLVDPDLRSLLDGVAAFFRRYVVFADDAQLVATTLHVAHAHAIEAADATPYLNLTSAEKRSGKTRTLEVYELVCPDPVRGSSMSPSTLFRVLDAGRRTLLLDEVDAIFSPKSDREELRGLLNAGYRRGSPAWRVNKVQGQFVPTAFDAFGVKVLAGIGRLPDTIDDRCIGIPLPRRRIDEPLERFRYREAKAAADSIRERLTEWASEETIAKLREARPDLPDLDNDRALEGWEPLLAIADRAGGAWPAMARTACLTLHSYEAGPDDSVTVQTLRAIKEIFDVLGVDRIKTEDLLEELAVRDDGPWAYWFDDLGRTDREGHPVPPRKSGRKLARTLEAFDIKPDVINIPDGKNARGYMRDWFGEAWSRYVPSSRGTLTSVEERGRTLVGPAKDHVSPHESTFLNVCPDCGARSDRAGYDGHGMHCRRFYPVEATHA